MENTQTEKLIITTEGTTGEENGHKEILELVISKQNDFQNIMAIAEKEFKKAKKENPILEICDYKITEINFGEKKINLKNIDLKDYEIKV